MSENRYIVARDEGEDESYEKDNKYVVHFMGRAYQLTQRQMNEYTEIGCGDESMPWRAALLTEWFESDEPFNDLGREYARLKRMGEHVKWAPGLAA